MVLHLTQHVKDTSVGAKHFTANINEDDSDDAVSDLSNDDEQIPSDSTVQICAKKRKVKTPPAKLVPIETKMTPQPFISGILQEEGFGEK